MHYEIVYKNLDISILLVLMRQLIFSALEYMPQSTNILDSHIRLII